MKQLWIIPTMSFIKDIYQTVQTEPEKKGTFFSVVNYLVANDDVSGIKKKDMEDRFALRKSYGGVIAQLREKNIITEEPSSFILNSEAKNFLKPVLQSVLAKSYGNKYGQFTADDSDSSEVSILLDCRSELYKAF